MEFYEIRDDGQLILSSKDQIQRLGSYIVQGEGLRTKLQTEKKLGSQWDKKQNNMDPEFKDWVPITKKIMGRILHILISPEKAKDIYAVMQKNHIKIYSGWTWLLEQMEEQKKENHGFLILGDHLYHASIQKGELKEFWDGHYRLFEDRDGVNLDFSKPGLWFIEREENR